MVPQIEFTLHNILFYLLLIAVSIQLLYYTCFYSRFVFYKSNRKYKNDYEDTLPVSIVIPVYAYKKERILKLINTLNQSPINKYELVLVMYSKVNSEGIFLDDIKKEYSQVKIVELHQEFKFIIGKKYLIAIGVKSATYENIILLDENCTISSPYWFVDMLSKFKDNKKSTELVLGAFNYKKDNDFTNKFIRFENAHYTMQYMSFALVGIPVMGTFKNIAFTKKVFFDNKGFSFFNDFIGGEDSLFVNYTCHGNNTDIEITKNSSLVTSQKTHSLSEWFYEKKVYISTIKYYKVSKKILIALYAISYMLFFPTLILITYFQLWNELSLNLLIIRFVVYYIIMLLVLNKLNEKPLIKWLPVMDILVPVYYYFISLQYLKNPKKIY